MLNTEGAVTTTLFGQEIEVADYFTSILGAPALNMGVFIGIIAGFLGATVYNKYYNYRGLPDVLSFFNGKRFVPLVVMVWSVVISIVLAIVWPVIQGGINAFGIWIANSSETSPILAPFIYGTLERLLLPFGLHHMLTIPMNYTSFGGTYTILTGANAGTQVFWPDPLWLAWVTDLINLKNAGDLAGYENLPHHRHPRPLQSGPDDRRHRPADRHRPGHAAPGGPRQAQELPLHVHLHHRRGPADRRHRAAGVHVMFCAIPLYVVYAVLQGVAFAMAGVIHLRLHSFGNLELLSRLPMSFTAGLGGDVLNFVICCVVFFINRLLCLLLHDRQVPSSPPRAVWATTLTTPATRRPPRPRRLPGRLRARTASPSGSSPCWAAGRTSWDVDACMTRLRVTVKDPRQGGRQGRLEGGGRPGPDPEGHRRAGHLRPQGGRPQIRYQRHL